MDDAVTLESGGSGYMSEAQREHIEHYLASVRVLEATVKRYEQEIEQLRAGMGPRAIDPTRERVQGHTPDSGAMWDKLLQARKRHELAWDRLIDRRGTVLAVLDQINDPLLSDLLYERYMSPVEPSWQQLADRFGYSVRNIYRVHDKALLEFSEVRKGYLKSCH